jgi:hypothetical protein
MKIKKFTILNPKEATSGGVQEVDMLINLDHIVSVKPIRIVGRDNIINGHWLRLTNGKKYRAIKIPVELEQILYEGGSKPVEGIYEDLDGGVDIGDFAQ